MSRFKELIRDVHRRSLWQVLAIYLVGAWIAYEVILGLTEGGVLPEWFPGVAVGLFLIGLPIVLATAFIQEGGPGAAKAGAPASATPVLSELEAPSAAGAADVSGPAYFLTWRNAVGLGVAAFVFAGLVGLTAMYVGGEATRSRPVDRSLAVLPLENMSPDQDDAFFTDGIHEEIITRLFRIQDLRTVARASVMEFGSTDRSLAEVAGALGVRYLLVGSVRRSGQRSRVSVSLVEPRTGEQLWADTYQATGTDVFAVQASIAENVAKALEAELTPGTRGRLATLPTTNSDAYDDYLRARDLHGRSYMRDDLEAAIPLYERAIEADPSFALAHARLGWAHVQTYWFHYDRSEDRLDAARHHIVRALELDPGLPEAHVAMARYHYQGRLAYDDALRELDIAATGLPGDPDIAVLRASIHRRAGRFQAAIAEYERGTELDPNAWEGWWNLAETYNLVRRFDDAIDAANRSTSGNLNRGDAWTLKAHIRLHGLGQPRAALATLDSVSGDVAASAFDPELERVDAYHFLRQYDRALAATELAHRPGTQFNVRPPVLVRALIHDAAGNGPAADAAFDSARTILERELAQRSEDVRLMGALAIALAGTDRPQPALELARRALELLPPEREAWRGAQRVLELAIVETMTGRHEEAIANLDWLLSRPSPLSTAGLQLDPTWDPLRHHPDFQRLLQH